jgi:cell division septation protein DedD
MRRLAVVLVLVSLTALLACSEKQKEAARLEAQMKQQDRAGDSTAPAGAAVDSQLPLATEPVNTAPEETTLTSSGQLATPDTTMPAGVSSDTAAASAQISANVVSEPPVRAADTPLSIRETASEPAPDAGAIPEEEKTNEQPATRRPAGSGYVVQIASSPSEKESRDLVAKYIERGYQAHVTEGVVNGTTYYRVRIGTYGSMAEANQALADMHQKYSTNGFVAQVK